MMNKSRISGFIVLFFFLLISASAAFSQSRWYVNGTTGDDSNSGQAWEQAFGTVTRALYSAGSGDEIWVAKGTYSPGTTTASAFALVSGVKMYGGFAGTETGLAQRDISKLRTENETILDGNSTSYH
ncbi:MAG TPA: DUF1565 domain-containing protein, partial [Sphingobacteriaceae bacterium]